MKITTIGVDIAKSVFHLFAVNQAGRLVKKKQLKRKQVLNYLANIEPRKISWTWNLWEIWAEKTNNHTQIMAIVLIKNDSEEFFVQIFHKTMERFSSPPNG